MPQITAGQAFVDALLANGVDTAFGLPGVQMYGLFDAFYGAQNRLRLVGARHEQTTAYMAFGYARSTGRLGVYSVVPGPGVLNTTAALCTAQGACTPVLCLTGEVPSGFMGQGRGHLHELRDQLGVLERLGKWAAHIDRAEDIPAYVNAAVTQAMSGRPGATALSICWDVLESSADIPSLPGAELPPPPEADPDQIAEAVKLIKDARMPMIFVGTGALHAGAEVLELAELLGAPVCGFRGGRGIVGDDHPLGFSIAPARTLWPKVDLIISIGSRLEMPYFRWGGMLEYRRRLPGRKLIRLDIDPAEMSKLDTDGPIVADAATGTRALVAALRAANFNSSVDRQAVADAKRQGWAEIQVIQPQMDYLKVIRDVLPRDGFLVGEISQMGFTAELGFPVYAPRTFVNCGHQGTLGYGFPTALGVKVGHPGKAVVSMTGDGGFMFAAQELATAVQYNIALVTIVFDNQAFGNVRRDQQQRYHNHIIGADLVNPDFVKLAESFGVMGLRADSPAALKPALEKAIGLNAPVLIHCPVPRGSETSPWPFILTKE